MITEVRMQQISSNGQPIREVVRAVAAQGFILHDASDSPIQLNYIDGLDPPSAEDLSIKVGARRELGEIPVHAGRNLVVTSDLPVKTYVDGTPPVYPDATMRFISSNLPTGMPVRVTIDTIDLTNFSATDKVSYTIDGNVENITTSRFSDGVAVQVSILCPQPGFKKVGEARQSHAANSKRVDSVTELPTGLSYEGRTTDVATSTLRVSGSSSASHLASHVQEVIFRTGRPTQTDVVVHGGPVDPSVHFAHENANAWSYFDGDLDRFVIRPGSNYFSAHGYRTSPTGLWYWDNLYGSVS